MDKAKAILDLVDIMEEYLAALKLELEGGIVISSPSPGIPVLAADIEATAKALRRMVGSGSYGVE